MVSRSIDVSLGCSIQHTNIGLLIDIEVGNLELLIGLIMTHE